MGTFDSVYLNKIRHLEEENQQLRNIIDEAFAGISRRTLPKLEDLPTPIDGRGAFGGRGISPEAQREWLQSLKNPKIDKIDLSKIVPEYDNKYILDRKPTLPEDALRDSDAMKRFLRQQPKPGDAGPMPRPQGRSEPAPYASDDMESRRVQPGYGGADGPEGIKDQFGRARDHWRYGEPPLMPKGGFGRPIKPGMGGLYR